MATPPRRSAAPGKNSKGLTPKRSTGGLTPKQENFAQEYVSHCDASVASRASGLDLTNDRSGYYVYFLIDPDTNFIFYVGKGKGDRLTHHVKAVNRVANENCLKTKVIAEILQRGMSVKEVVFASGLPESMAFFIEKSLIQRFKHTGLTNISGGVVSQIDAAAAKAEVLLDRMVSLDAWILRVSDERKQAIVRMYGSPENCYKSIRAEYEWVIDYAKSQSSQA